MNTSDIERERMRVALARAVADHPTEVASACQWCGTRCTPGEGDTGNDTWRADGLMGRPSGVQTRIISGQIHYLLPGWRRCAICARSASMNGSLGWAYVAVDIATGRALPLRYGKAAAELGRRFAESSELLLYAMTPGVDSRDPGNEAPWQHLAPEMVERWATRYADLKARFAAPPDPPCAVCGRTEAQEWRRLESEHGRLCGVCRMAPREGVFTTLEDWAASRAAGLERTEAGFGRYVDFAVAADHPNFATDEQRGPWEYLDPDDRAALRGLVDKMARENAERRRRQAAEHRRRAAGRLKIPEGADQ